jgi:hypothetical protein
VPLGDLMNKMLEIENAFPIVSKVLVQEIVDTESVLDLEDSERV